MNIQQDIRTKVQELQLPEQEQTAAIEVIRTNLFKRVGLRIAEQLPDEAMQQFVHLAENDELAALNYVNDTLDNFETIVQAELDQIIEEYELLS